MWSGNSTGLSRSLRDVLASMERLGGSLSRIPQPDRGDRHDHTGRADQVGTFAEFERVMLRERTKAGLDAARQDGRIDGRRPKLSAQQQSEIRKMVTKGNKTAADAARLFKVHLATASRLLTRAEALTSKRRVTRAK